MTLGIRNSDTDCCSRLIDKYFMVTSIFNKNVIRSCFSFSCLVLMQTENHLSIPNMQRVMLGALRFLFVLFCVSPSSAGSVFNLKRGPVLFRMHAAGFPRVCLPEPCCYQLCCLSDSQRDAENYNSRFKLFAAQNPVQTLPSLQLRLRSVEQKPTKAS